MRQALVQLALSLPKGRLAQAHPLLAAWVPAAEALWVRLAPSLPKGRSRWVEVATP
jgi:hypothetical protein